MSYAHFSVGDKVYHPKHGDGVVTFVNPRRRENIAVVFEKGGPQGFSNDATNDTADLYASKESYDKIQAERAAVAARKAAKQ